MLDVFTTFTIYSFEITAVYESFYYNNPARGLADPASNDKDLLDFGI